MRVLLIHSNKYSFGQLPKKIEGERGLNPPISLAYVASVARNYNHQVKILDLDAEKVKIDKIPNYIINFKPDIVGFQVLTNNLNEIIKLSKIIKQVNKDIIVVYGGVQLEIYPEFTISNENVDIGVIGEAEHTFPELLNNLEKNLPLNNVKGLIYKQNGRLIKTAKRENIQDLDTIPFPSRDLLHNSRYNSLISKRSPITIALTSRGCPYNCSFCYRPACWNNIRYNSPNYVVREFESCLELGIKEILIYDDIFTLNKPRVKSICDKLIKQNLDITWDIRTRIDQINGDLLDWLWKAGCKRINYGVESADEKILDIYNKKININKAREVFKLTRDYGFETLAYFMIGAPGETKESANKTIQLMLDLDPDYIHLTHLIPYPKTVLFDLAIQRGLATENTWKNLEYLSLDKIPMFTDGELSREDIFNLVKKGYRKFYYRPKYIYRKLKNIHNFRVLWNYIKAAMSI